MSDEYPHQVPRMLHKPYGETCLVKTAEDCDAALADGWVLRPPVWPPEERPIIESDPDPAPKRKGKAR